ncbi:MAG: oxygen-independent coproporphyrinogen III oxidase [Propylenella sp.]
MEAGLVEKLSATSAPRYTSYPTAPHFHAGVGSETYAGWLASLAAGTSVSLYLHIPFCDTLCWFCGCNTKATRHYAPVAEYLRALHQEIALVGGMLPPGVVIRHIHWGGGSPTLLTAEDISALAAAIRRAFTVDRRTDFAVEIDPRGLSSEQTDALIAAGLTRASFGVQDFDRTVQQAINRIQSFNETKAVIEGFRRGGIMSINIDVLYGLPHQNLGRLTDTLLKVLSLDPDRIALFGYAHVPWMKKHQAMIMDADLPGAAERFEQAQRAGDLIAARGYRRIGIDHFAKPEDPLAMAARAGRLRRNFQGYTADESEVVIGLGASAIGRLPQGFVQNIVPTREYERQVGDGRLPVARGIELTREDRVRAYAIERLMCDFSLRDADLRARFGAEADEVIAEADRIAPSDYAGFVTREGGMLSVTEDGRPFVRLICAAFDAYFGAGAARHSAAV